MKIRKNGTTTLIHILMVALCCGQSTVSLSEFCGAENVSQQKQIVLFDLGDTLFRTSITKALANDKKLLLKIALYLTLTPSAIPQIMKHGFGPYLRMLLYNFLNALQPNPGIVDVDELPRDPLGLVMPDILADYMRGVYGGEHRKLFAKIRTFVLENPQFFTSQAHRALVVSLTKTLFNPKSLAHSLTCIESMTQFVRGCHRDGHKLYVLSNLDSQTFEMLLEAHPDFFSLFNGFFVSGSLGLLKPDRAIYDTVTQTLGVEPAQCILFDDREENINSARAFGMEGVLCKPTQNGFSIENIKNQYRTIVAA